MPILKAKKSVNEIPANNIENIYKVPSKNNIAFFKPQNVALATQDSKENISEGNALNSTIHHNDTRTLNLNKTVISEHITNSGSIRIFAPYATVVLDAPITSKYGNVEIIANTIRMTKNCKIETMQESIHLGSTGGDISSLGTKLWSGNNVIIKSGGGVILDHYDLKSDVNEEIKSTRRLLK